MIKIKTQLRKQILDKRNSLSSSKLTQKSQSIFTTITNSNIYKNCDTIFTFVSVGSEVDTISLINKGFQDNKKIFVPIAKKNEDMFFVEIKDLNHLEKTKFGVLEPTIYTTKNNTPTLSSLFIVPGTAFDTNMNRCGYGGGFYDKYLVNYPWLKKIGICFDLQILDHIPTDDYDIKMNTIISEYKTLGEEI